LKSNLLKAPVLKLLDFDKDFQIHFDASDFAIGKILVQNGWSMPFESKDVERNKAKVANT
jgi:nitrogen fixation protein